MVHSSSSRSLNKSSCRSSTRVDSRKKESLYTMRVIVMTSARSEFIWKRIIYKRRDKCSFFIVYLERSHDFVRHFDGVRDVFVRVLHTGETSLVLRRSQVHASL